MSPTLEAFRAAGNASPSFLTKCANEESGMSHDTPHSNPFLNAPLGALFLKTAAPIVFVMSMNGLLTVMDAVMLGLYVGPQAG